MVAPSSLSNIGARPLRQLRKEKRRAMGDRYPPGYRFYPTEEELLSFYLHNKLHNLRDDIERLIPVVNFYAFDPWQLPQIAGERSIQDSELFFFCPRQEREVHGGRPTRTTPSGYWKATGSPSFVYSSNNRAIGLKKTMAFYTGRVPTGRKTQWKMNEYKAFEEDAATAPAPAPAPAPPAATRAPRLRSEFSLCRVYMKSGRVRSFDRRPSVTASSSESRNMAEVLASNSEVPSAERNNSHDSSTTSGDGGSLDALFGESMDWKLPEELDWD